MKDDLPCLSKTKNGVLLRVHVQPRARREEICGLHGDRLKIAIKAPPSDGKANEALSKFIAKVMDCPLSAITLKSGASSRQKTFLIDSLSYSKAIDILGRFCD